MLIVTSESFEIFKTLDLIFSMSAPFFPITNPGLDVCIETISFLPDLSIIISDTPEFKIFFLIYFLILKSSIKYFPKSFFLANQIESQPLLTPSLNEIGLIFCPIIIFSPQL